MAEISPTSCILRVVPCARCHTSEPLIFHADLALQQELGTSETIPDDLHWWLIQHDVRVSQTATVAIKEKGNTWMVTDTENNRTYSARKTGDKIVIYAGNFYWSYTCIKCHEHNTEEIQLAHELHGVADYHRGFVCHQTEIDGITYGRQRTNWDYDPNW